jgi:hypothetical protein
MLRRVATELDRYDDAGIIRTPSVAAPTSERAPRSRASAALRADAE